MDIQQETLSLIQEMINALESFSSRFNERMDDFDRQLDALKKVLEDKK